MKFDEKNEKRIILASSDECTGCGACYNACEFDSIIMDFNKEGFLEPTIVKENCKYCGSCSKACPVLEPIYINSHEPLCYAAQAEDEIRRLSSSGGIFTLLAERVINLGGFVAGASWNKDFLVEHILINEIDKLDLLRRSKYIQSNTKTIYREIEKLLDDKKLVLFSGCPCQIAGIYGYLGGDNPYLYTVEVMCHSVASPLAFLRYLKENFNIDSIYQINFRDKAFNWATQFYGLSFIFHNGNSIKVQKDFDIFFKSFDICLSTRKACGTCKFSRLPRQADITLADFWGVRRFDHEFADPLGTSLVIINSRKGIWLFTQIKNNLKKLKTVPFEFVKTLGQPLEKPFKSHPHRDRFFRLLNIKNYSFKKAFHYSTKKLYDVGVVGFWFGLNYGSCLTYFGLAKKLQDFGLSILLLDKPKDFGNDIEFTDTHSRRFSSKFFDTSESVFIREFGKFNSNCDLFVLGSDQLWNYELSRLFGKILYLDFVEENKKKVSYATSFGHAQDFTPEHEKIVISHLLKRFDHISVREKASIYLLKEIYGVDAEWVLDPLFLLDIDDFYEIASMAKIKEKDDYILAYILDATYEKRNFIINLSQKLGIKIITIIDVWPHTHEKNTKILGFENIFKVLEIEDFIYLFSSEHCKYIVSDSYHGMLLSIILNKPFSIFVNTQRGSLRFDNIADNTAPELLRSRFIYEYSNKELNDIIDKHTSPFDGFEIIRKEINKHKVRSAEWLKKALFSKKVIEDFKIYECVTANRKNFRIKFHPLTSHSVSN